MTKQINLENVLIDLMKNSYVDHKILNKNILVVSVKTAYIIDRVKIVKLLIHAKTQNIFSSIIFKKIL